MFIESSANVFLLGAPEERNVYREQRQRFSLGSSAGAKYLIAYAAPKGAEWLMLIPRL